ncbi:biotin transporter BioY [Tomitella biformata]|uniref:biotin transporter BioY n=1 Tax=Tomitella biformata TaxID=630403 RepID=UPI000462F24F|nr:biotin transporter BioY [Tomitella biformata]
MIAFPSAVRLSARDLAQIAVFAALIVALGLPGQLNIGTSGVPITLQSMGIMLAGAILGARKGCLSVLVVIALSMAGLPILAGGRSGLTAIVSPTAGYLIGWIPAVIVIGLLTKVLMPRYNVVAGIGINIIGGLVVMYACGVVGLVWRADLSLNAAIATNFLYLPGDLVKAVVTALVAAQVHRSYPGLITPFRSKRVPFAEPAGQPA